MANFVGIVYCFDLYACLVHFRCLDCLCILMSTPTRISAFIKMKQAKLERLEQLLKKQAKDVGRIIDNRSKYDISDVLTRDEDGVHVFPKEYREKPVLSSKGKIRKEMEDQRRLEWAHAHTYDLPPGMTSERVAAPFLIEQFPTFTIRGNAWIDPINQALDELDSILPRAPFVLACIGGINAGKTNVIAHMLTIYMHYCFQNVWFVSPTGKLDPTIDTIACSRPPKDSEHKCNFKFFNSVPHDLIEEAANSVIAQNTPATDTGARGKYHEVPEQHQLATARLLPPPSLSTPSIDIFGNPLMHTGLFPNELSLKPNALGENSYVMKSFSERNTRNPFMTNVEKEIGYGITKSDVSEYSSKPWLCPLRNLNGFVMDDVLQMSRMITAYEETPSTFNPFVYDYWLGHTPFKETLTIDRSEFVAGREHAGVFKNEPYKNALLVIDDCNQIFGNKSQKAAIKAFITEIRHRHMCLILGAQKSTLIPRDIWAQTIAACIWGTREERQRRRIQEDYGANIPNFEWVFDYCTRPDPEQGLDNPFMYVNLASNPPRVYKCFTEEITWDPNVVEVPKKMSASASTSLMTSSAASSLHSTTPPRRSKAALLSNKSPAPGTSRVK